MNDVAWSVIVPTYNRHEPLESCLNTLAALQPPKGGFEIVVVNDGGAEPPNTLRAAARFFTQANAGPAAARNTGARYARGARLAFTDDDCTPDPGWLLALDAALDEQPDALAGGPVLNALDRNLLSETSQQLVYFVGRWFDGTTRERFFTSNNLGVSRAAFLDAGGFDERLGRPSAEDRELCDRWSAQGRPTAHVPSAIVHHSHALTLRSFLRQHYDYGRGARRFRAVRRDADRPVRIDPRFYIESLRHAWRQRPGLDGAALALGTAAAHAAYAAGLLAARREG